MKKSQTETKTNKTKQLVLGAGAQELAGGATGVASWGKGQGVSWAVCSLSQGTI